MKLNEMKQVLAREQIRLTKSLGQNFLHDGNQLRRIVEAGNLSPMDKVLEIGTGLGPLTAALLERGAQVLAIEKDRRLFQFLEGRFAEELQGEPPKLRLVHGDALAFLQEGNHEWQQWKLVANLPYSSASAMLVELAQARHGPERMVATLQLEVARRLMAAAGASDYGLLTVLVHMDYEPRDWFRIPAGCFFPEPDVDSACVCLVRRPGERLPGELRPVFVQVVKRCFSQRRKMMFKLLKEDWETSRLEAAFAQLELPREARAETIPPHTFIRLTELLHAKS